MKTGAFAISSRRHDGGIVASVKLASWTPIWLAVAAVCMITFCISLSVAADQQWAPSAAKGMLFPVGALLVASLLAALTTWRSGRPPKA